MGAGKAGYDGWHSGRFGSMLDIVYCLYPKPSIKTQDHMPFPPPTSHLPLTQKPLPHTTAYCTIPHADIRSDMSLHLTDIPTCHLHGCLPSLPTPS